MREARTSAAAGAGIDLEMMRLVAELYYLRDLRQPEIARLTKFSISKVSRLLAHARELGIVRISVEPASAEQPPLGRELADALGVDVHVTPGRESPPTVAARLCGVAAVPYVVEQLPVAGTIGLAGGYTVEAFVSALPRLDRPNVTIVPLVGGWDARNPHLDSNEIARHFGERIGAAVRFLHAPGMLDSVATKDALLADSAIQATTAYWQHLEFAIAGVSGGPLARPGYGTVMDRLEQDGRNRLVDKGVVGDVSGHLFRIDGTIIDDEWSRRTISIPLDLLTRTPRVVVVAAGSNKISGIIGSARTGLVHAIVTDRPTAEAALQVLRGERRTRPRATERRQEVAAPAG